MIGRNSQRDDVELVVLSLLVSGPRHGYGIGKELAARSEGSVRLSPGVLYPLLRELEQASLIHGIWDDAAAGRRRCSYQLTPKGHKALEKRLAAHRAFRALVDALTAARSPDGVAT
jgi:DNA-binding PadR family transcriptional regulator